MIITNISTSSFSSCFSGQKKLKYLIAKKILILFFITTTPLFSNKAQSQNISVSFQVFYDELSPYGQWMRHPGYGYVWIPVSSVNFFPYSTDGHWSYTNYGWTWVSDFSWGWAPFHYGGWDYDPYYGWFWVPDVAWGPAWVVWRYSKGYYGWTPLMPGHNHKNVSDNSYYGRRDHWTFTEEKYFGRREMNNHYAPRTSNKKIINNSTIINNIQVDKDRDATYIIGPGKEDVEKKSEIKITPLKIEERAKPGQSMSNDQVNIYRPRIAKGNTNGTEPTPAKVADPKEVKSISERNANKPDQPKQITPKDEPTLNDTKAIPKQQPEPKPEIRPEKNEQNPPRKSEIAPQPQSVPNPEKPQQVPKPDVQLNEPNPPKKTETPNSKPLTPQPQLPGNPEKPQPPSKPDAPIVEPKKAPEEKPVRPTTQQQPKPVVTPRVNPQGNQSKGSAPRSTEKQKPPSQKKPR